MCSIAGREFKKKKPKFFKIVRTKINSCPMLIVCNVVLQESLTLQLKFGRKTKSCLFVFLINHWRKYVLNQKLTIVEWLIMSQIHCHFQSPFLIATSHIIKGEEILSFHVVLALLFPTLFFSCSNYIGMFLWIRFTKTHSIRNIPI